MFILEVTQHYFSERFVYILSFAIVYHRKFSGKLIITLQPAAFHFQVSFCHHFTDRSFFSVWEVRFRVAFEFRGPRNSDNPLEIYFAVILMENRKPTRPIDLFHLKDFFSIQLTIGAIGDQLAFYSCNGAAQVTDANCNSLLSTGTMAQFW